MISVLIPSFNVDVVPLVDFLQEQASVCSIIMEVIIWDDASTSDFSFLNERDNVSFFQSTTNKGRAATRELLAEKAKYPYLLFLDADVFPTTDLFLLKYLNHASEETILVGGIKYEENKPENNRFFRWFYGKAREEISVENRLKKPYNHFMTGNFLVPKKIFLRFPLQDISAGYGHEDTLLGFKFQMDKISVCHIDNPVFHLGLDENEVFLNKSKEAVSSLLLLKELGYKLPTSLNLGYDFLEKFYLVNFLAKFYPVLDKIAFKKYMFSGRTFSLFLFDLYRLVYLCSISLDRGK